MEEQEGKDIPGTKVAVDRDVKHKIDEFSNQMKMKASRNDMEMIVR